MSVVFKKFLLMFIIGFCLGGNNAFASDNVLQAVQIDGVNDSYNIILKSDDVAEIRKTVQAPNKIVLLLKGIRASKTINTIYNNTASVDSVVVEPTGDDSVKILIQATNVGTAKIHFDSLKTPLGVLGNSEAPTKSNGEITLSDPMNSFRPVYKESTDEDESATISLANAGGSLIKYSKKVLNSGKSSWLVTFGLFALLILNGMKLIKGKDNEIKIGLRQSLQDREIDLYKGLGVANMNESVNNNLSGQPINHSTAGSGIQRNISNANYGLKSYQNGVRSPYATPEIQRPRPIAPAPQSAPAPQQVLRNLQTKSPIQSAMQNTIQKTAPTAASASRSTNIDSMKFLESMTKIYEKNGRADLAQGLKTNMKKAQANAGNLR